MNRDIWLVLGGVAAGALVTALVMKNKEKIKPATAGMLAKAMNLKDKAANYVSKTKDQAEEIVAEARHINETAAQ